MPNDYYHKKKPSQKFYTLKNNAISKKKLTVFGLSLFWLAVVEQPFQVVWMKFSVSARLVVPKKFFSFFYGFFLPELFHGYFSECRSRPCLQEPRQWRDPCSAVRPLGLWSR